MNLPITRQNLFATVLDSLATELEGKRGVVCGVDLAVEQVVRQEALPGQMMARGHDKQSLRGGGSRGDRRD